MAEADSQARLIEAATEFGVVLGDPLAGGFRSSVFAARTAAGEDVVIKVPATMDEARAEIAALSRWRNSGAAVRVIEVDHDRGVLLLERIMPGNALPPAEPDTLGPVAEILQRLHTCDPGDYPFPSLEQGYPAAEAQARSDLVYERETRGEPDRGAAGFGLLGSAKETVADLARTTHDARLLHGDFTNKNLLASGSGFLAIDPIPRMGDACSDVAHFAAAQPPDLIFEIAMSLGSMLDLDQERVLRWTAVNLVIQDCQAWRDDQAGLDQLLAQSEVRFYLDRR